MILLIKARTNSEWDDCNCFAIELESFNKIPFDTILNFLEKNKLYKVCEFSAGQFLIWDEEKDYPLHDKSWTLIDKLPDHTTNPGNRLDSLLYHVKVQGVIQFVDFGEHTEDQFFTNSIKITDVLQTKI